MCSQLRTLGVSAAAGIALLISGACAATSPRPAAQPAMPAAPAATEPDPAHAATPPGLAPAATSAPVAAPPISAVDVQRQRAQLERRLEIASLALAKAQIEVELGQLKYRDTIARVDKEFELAKKRLQIFERMTAPSHRARAELDLQLAEDSLAEAQEDLYQAELQYGAQETPDRGQELAIERARRRLERTQRDVELRREEFKTLTEVLLPLEQQELELAAEVKKRAALQAQRDDEGPGLDRKMAVLSAEAEVRRLEAELIQLSRLPE